MEGSQGLGSVNAPSEVLLDTEGKAAEWECEAQRRGMGRIYDFGRLIYTKIFLIAGSLLA